MNRAIIFSVLFAFIISISFLIISQYKIQENIIQEENLNSNYLLLQESSVENKTNKVFILGSSHVMVLNNTHIQQELSKNNYQNYSVYNLGIGADTPKERLREILLIIDANPEIIVYGVGFRDFESVIIGKSQLKKSTGIFPDLEKIFGELRYLLFNSLKVDLDFIQSPKINTLTYVRNFFKNGTNENTGLPNPHIIKTNLELEKNILMHPPYLVIEPSFKNKNVYAIKEIIKELQNNNINIVLFTTPHSKFYINAIDDSKYQMFNNILQEINDELGVNTVFLHEKYVMFNIFTDNQHVASNENSIIYSNDISEIIIKEIES